MKRASPRPVSPSSRSRLTRRLIMAGCAGMMLASLGLLLWVDQAGASRLTAPSAAAAASPETLAAAAAPAPTATAGQAADEQRLGAWLQARYGGKLAHPYWRLQVIESLKRYLMEKYPHDWRERLRAMLARYFPADLDRLMASFEAWEAYNEWLAGIKHNLTFTSREERLRATWDKRLQLFGEDAKLIWAAQLQQEKVETALKQLDTPSLPLGAKVDRYVQTLVEVYGPDARNPDRSHPVQQMEGLLSLASVQDQLHQMTPEQRREELQHLRTALGLDAEAVKRWDDLDAERNARAAAGATYQKEKQVLASRFQGEALELQVQALQNRLFGPEEAQYIRNEEETGFYRFEERQQIGIN